MSTFANLWNVVRVNKSNRPILQTDEVIVFVQNNVGLYQGKVKIADRQDGRIYLTNQRIVYLDNKDQAKSISLSFEHVVRAAAVERFLRSSPKVKVFLRRENDVEEVHNKPSPVNPTSHWLCRICSYSNLIIRTDADEYVKCAACGIKSKRTEVKFSEPDPVDSSKSTRAVVLPESSNNQCAVCTFINHPMIKNCEMCGTELSTQSYAPQKAGEQKQVDILLCIQQEEYTDSDPYVKFSFRQGGSIAFYLHLQSTLEEYKWQQLQQRGAINENGKLLVERSQTGETDSLKYFGIHGLQRRGEHQRQENELILNSSLLDFEQLMFKYLDLLRVSETLGQSSKLMLVLDNQSKNEPIIATNLMDSSQQPQEIARQISEYLVNVKLSKLSSIITTQDLYSSYNRHLVLSVGYGTPLLGPNEFNKAIGLMNNMDLPVVQRIYGKSGLVVLSHRGTTEQASQDNIIKFMRTLEEEFYRTKFTIETRGLNDAQLILQYHHYSGCSASQVAESLGWSYNIAAEEISSCVEAGRVVIDQSLSGKLYFVSFMEKDYEISPEGLKKIRLQVEQEITREQQDISVSLQSQYAYENRDKLVNIGDTFDFGIIQPEAPNESHDNSTGEMPLRDLEGLRFV